MNEDTYPRRDDESEEYVSYDVSGAERGGDGDVAGICDRWTPGEVDRRHDGVPDTHHDDDRHRRDDVHVLDTYVTPNKQSTRQCYTVHTMTCCHS